MKRSDYDDIYEALTPSHDCDDDIYEALTFSTGRASLSPKIGDFRE